MEVVFNNNELLQQAWYPVIPSHKLKKGSVKGFTLHKQRLALYRDEQGKAHALFGLCPHMGADLSQGKLYDGKLQCPFHGWEFSTNGACTHIPNTNRIPSYAKTFSYPVEEKHGFVWVFNGPEPKTIIPEPVKDDRKMIRFRLPVGKMKGNTHIIMCNGLDIQHWKTLHHMEFFGEPETIVDDEYRLGLRFNILPDGHTWLARFIRKVLKKPIQMEYTTTGGTTAYATASVLNTKLEVLFAHIPQEGGGSTGRAIYYLRLAKGLRIIPQMLYLPFVLGVLFYVLTGDMNLFNTVQFRPGLIPEDTYILKYICKVNKLGAFNAWDMLLKDRKHNAAGIKASAFADEVANAADNPLPHS